MQAQITSFKACKSKYGDIFYYLFFKDEYGKSYKSCIYTNMRNYYKWQKVIGMLKQYNPHRGLVLDGLSIKEKTLNNADSPFVIVGMRKFEKPKPPQSNNPITVQQKLF